MKAPQHRPGRVALRLADLSIRLAAMETRMTALSDAVAQLTTDDEALETEVTDLIATINGIPAQVASAVQAALTAAGVDDAAQVTALASVDAAVKASTASAIAALTPAPPAA